MSKMIQVRDVPDDLHRELVRRARVRGLTLTAYIQGILEREVSRPSIEDYLERLQSHEPVDPGEPIADIIRRERPGGDE